MKKHLFLTVDTRSTVKLSALEERQIKKWLLICSPVLEELFKKNILRCKPKTISVSLMICGDTKIRELNRNYRQKNKVTDVLSFPAHEDLRKQDYKFDDLFLGDLAICYSQMKRQAGEFQIRPIDEFIHLFFHGLLHLMGFDHELNSKEEKLMEKWEADALDIFQARKSNS